MKKVVTIARNPHNSPNMVANDAALLESTRAALTAMGAMVQQIDECDEIPSDAHAICSMSRTPHTLQRLKEAEAAGTLVFNSTGAVKNCSRTRFMELLSNNKIPMPQYKIIANANELEPSLFPCWIKLAHGWSCHCGDVCYAETPTEAHTAIKQMQTRGHTQFVQMQHAVGDIIKVYGIDKDFFHWYYPRIGSSKFGLEQHNGAHKHHPFNAIKLKELTQAAANALKLDIYGGDCIVAPNGNIYIIDINDFPSFSPVRREAAEAIAELIMKRIG